MSKKKGPGASPSSIRRAIDRTAGVELSSAPATGTAARDEPPSMGSVKEYMNSLRLTASAPPVQAEQAEKQAAVEARTKAIGKETSAFLERERTPHVEMDWAIYPTGKPVPGVPPLLRGTERNYDPDTGHIVNDGAINRPPDGAVVTAQRELEDAPTLYKAEIDMRRRNSKSALYNEKVAIDNKRRAELAAALFKGDLKGFDPTNLQHWMEVTQRPYVPYEDVGKRMKELSKKANDIPAGRDIGSVLEGMEAAKRGTLGFRPELQERTRKASVRLGRDPKRIWKAYSDPQTMEDAMFSASVDIGAAALLYTLGGPAGFGGGEAVGLGLNATKIQQLGAAIAKNAPAFLLRAPAAHALMTSVPGAVVAQLTGEGPMHAADVDPFLERFGISAKNLPIEERAAVANAINRSVIRNNERRDILAKREGARGPSVLGREGDYYKHRAVKSAKDAMIGWKYGENLGQFDMNSLREYLPRVAMTREGQRSVHEMVRDSQRLATAYQPDELMEHVADGFGAAAVMMPGFIGAMKAAGGAPVGVGKYIGNIYKASTVYKGSQFAKAFKHLNHMKFANSALGNLIRATGLGLTTNTPGAWKNAKFQYDQLLEEGWSPAKAALAAFGTMAMSNAVEYISEAGYVPLFEFSRKMADLTAKRAAKRAVSMFLGEGFEETVARNMNYALEESLGIPDRFREQKTRPFPFAFDSNALTEAATDYIISAALGVGSAVVTQPARDFTRARAKAGLLPIAPLAPLRTKYRSVLNLMTGRSEKGPYSRYARATAERWAKKYGFDENEETVNSMAKFVERNEGDRYKDIARAVESSEIARQIKTLHTDAEGVAKSAAAKAKAAETVAQDAETQKDGEVAKAYRDKAEAMTNEARDELDKALSMRDQALNEFLAGESRSDAPLDLRRAAASRAMSSDNVHAVIGQKPLYETAEEAVTDAHFTGRIAGVVTKSGRVYMAPITAANENGITVGGERVGLDEISEVDFEGQTMFASAELLEEDGTLRRMREFGTEEAFLDEIGERYRAKIDMDVFGQEMGSAMDSQDFGQGQRLFTEKDGRKVLREAGESRGLDMAKYNDLKKRADKINLINDLNAEASGPTTVGFYHRGPLADVRGPEHTVEEEPPLSDTTPSVQDITPNLDEEGGTEVSEADIAKAEEEDKERAAETEERDKTPPSAPEDGGIFGTGATPLSEEHPNVLQTTAERLDRVAEKVRNSLKQFEESGTAPASLVGPFTPKAVKDLVASGVEALANGFRTLDKFIAAMQKLDVVKALTDAWSKSDWADLMSLSYDSMHGSLLDVRTKRYEAKTRMAGAQAFPVDNETLASQESIRLAEARTNLVKSISNLARTPTSPDIVEFEDTVSDAEISDLLEAPGVRPLKKAADIYNKVKNKEFFNEERLKSAILETIAKNAQMVDIPTLTITDTSPDDSPNMDNVRLEEGTEVNFAPFGHRFINMSAFFKNNRFSTQYKGPATGQGSARSTHLVFIQDVKLRFGSRSIKKIATEKPEVFQEYVGKLASEGYFVLHPASDNQVYLALRAAPQSVARSETAINGTLKDMRVQLLGIKEELDERRNELSAEEIALREEEMDMIREQAKRIVAGESQMQPHDLVAIVLSAFNRHVAGPDWATNALKYTKRFNAIATRSQVGSLEVLQDLLQQGQLEKLVARATSVAPAIQKDYRDAIELLVKHNPDTNTWEWNTIAPNVPVNSRDLHKDANLAARLLSQGWTLTKAGVALKLDKENKVEDVRIVVVPTEHWLWTHPETGKTITYSQRKEMLDAGGDQAKLAKEYTESEDGASPMNPGSVLVSEMSFGNLHPRLKLVKIRLAIAFADALQPKIDSTTSIYWKGEMEPGTGEYRRFMIENGVGALVTSSTIKLGKVGWHLHNPEELIRTNQITFDAPIPGSTKVAMGFGLAPLQNISKAGAGEFQDRHVATMGFQVFAATGFNTFAFNDAKFKKAYDTFHKYLVMRSHRTNDLMQRMFNDPNFRHAMFTVFSQELSDDPMMPAVMSLFQTAGFSNPMVSYLPFFQQITGYAPWNRLMNGLFTTQGGTDGSLQAIGFPSYLKADWGVFGGENINAVVQGVFSQTQYKNFSGKSELVDADVVSTIEKYFEVDDVVTLSGLYSQIKKKPEGENAPEESEVDEALRKAYEGAHKALIKKRLSAMSSADEATIAAEKERLGLDNKIRREAAEIALKTFKGYNPVTIDTPSGTRTYYIKGSGVLKSEVDGAIPLVIPGNRAAKFKHKVGDKLFGVAIPADSPHSAGSFIVAGVNTAIDDAVSWSPAKSKKTGKDHDGDPIYFWGESSGYWARQLEENRKAIAAGREPLLTPAEAMIYQAFDDSGFLEVDPQTFNEVWDHFARDDVKNMVTDVMKKVGLSSPFEKDANGRSKSAKMLRDLGLVRPANMSSEELKEAGLSNAAPLGLQNSTLTPRGHTRLFQDFLGIGSDNIGMVAAVRLRLDYVLQLMDDTSVEHLTLPSVALARPTSSPGRVVTKLNGKDITARELIYLTGSLLTHHAVDAPKETDAFEYRYDPELHFWGIMDILTDEMDEKEREALYSMIRKRLGVFDLMRSVMKKSVTFQESSEAVKFFGSMDKAFSFFKKITYPQQVAAAALINTLSDSDPTLMGALFSGFDVTPDTGMDIEMFNQMMVPIVDKMAMSAGYPLGLYDATLLDKRDWIGRNQADRAEQSMYGRLKNYIDSGSPLAKSAQRVAAALQFIGAYRQFSGNMDNKSGKKRLFIEHYESSYRAGVPRSPLQQVFSQAYDNLKEAAALIPTNGYVQISKSRAADKNGMMSRIVLQRNIGIASQVSFNFGTTWVHPASTIGSTRRGAQVVPKSAFIASFTPSNLDTDRKTYGQRFTDRIHVAQTFIEAGKQLKQFNINPQMLTASQTGAMIDNLIHGLEVELPPEHRFLMDVIRYSALSPARIMVGFVRHGSGVLTPTFTKPDDMQRTGNPWAVDSYNIAKPIGYANPISVSKTGTDFQLQKSRSPLAVSGVAYMTHGMRESLASELEKSVFARNWLSGVTHQDIDTMILEMAAAEIPRVQADLAEVLDTQRKLRNKVAKITEFSARKDGSLRDQELTEIDKNVAALGKLIDTLRGIAQRGVTVLQEKEIEELRKAHNNFGTMGNPHALTTLGLSGLVFALDTVDKLLGKIQGWIMKNKRASSLARRWREAWVTGVITGIDDSRLRLEMALSSSVVHVPDGYDEEGGEMSRPFDFGVIGNRHGVINPKTGEMDHATVATRISEILIMAGRYGTLTGAIKPNKGTYIKANVLNEIVGPHLRSVAEMVTTMKRHFDNLSEQMDFQGHIDKIDLPELKGIDNELARAEAINQILWRELLSGEHFGEWRYVYSPRDISDENGRTVVRAGWQWDHNDVRHGRHFNHSRNEHARGEKKTPADLVKDVLKLKNSKAVIQRFGTPLNAAYMLAATMEARQLFSENLLNVLMTLADVAEQRMYTISDEAPSDEPDTPGTLVPSEGITPHEHAAALRTYADLADIIEEVKAGGLIFPASFAGVFTKTNPEIDASISFAKLYEESYSRRDDIAAISKITPPGMTPRAIDSRTSPDYMRVVRLEALVRLLHSGAAPNLAAIERIAQGDRSTYKKLLEITDTFGSLRRIDKKVNAQARSAPVQAMKNDLINKIQTLRFDLEGMGEAALEKMLTDAYDEVYTVFEKRNQRLDPRAPVGVRFEGWNPLGARQYIDFANIVSSKHDHLSVLEAPLDTFLGGSIADGMKEAINSYLTEIVDMQARSIRDGVVRRVVGHDPSGENKDVLDAYDRWVQGNFRKAAYANKILDFEKLIPGEEVEIDVNREDRALYTDEDVKAGKKPAFITKKEIYRAVYSHKGISRRPENAGHPVYYFTFNTVDGPAWIAVDGKTKATSGIGTGSVFYRTDVEEAKKLPGADYDPTAKTVRVRTRINDDMLRNGLERFVRKDPESRSRWMDLYDDKILPFLMGANTLEGMEKLGGSPISAFRNWTYAAKMTGVMFGPSFIRSKAMLNKLKNSDEVEVYDAITKIMKASNVLSWDYVVNKVAGEGAVSAGGAALSRGRMRTAVESMYASIEAYHRAGYRAKRKVAGLKLKGHQAEIAFRRALYDEYADEMVKLTKSKKWKEAFKNLATGENPAARRAAWEGMTGALYSIFAMTEKMNREMVTIAALLDTRAFASKSARYDIGLTREQDYRRGIVPWHDLPHGLRKQMIDQYALYAREQDERINYDYSQIMRPRYLRQVWGQMIFKFATFAQASWVWRSRDYMDAHQFRHRILRGDVTYHDPKNLSGSPLTASARTRLVDLDMSVDPSQVKPTEWMRTIREVLGDDSVVKYDKDKGYHVVDQKKYDRMVAQINHKLGLEGLKIPNARYNPIWRITRYQAAQSIEIAARTVLPLKLAFLQEPVTNFLFALTDLVFGITSWVGPDDDDEVVVAVKYDADGNLLPENKWTYKVVRLGDDPRYRDLEKRRIESLLREVTMNFGLGSGLLGSQITRGALEFAWSGMDDESDDLWLQRGGGKTGRKLRQIAYELLKVPGIEQLIGLGVNEVARQTGSRDFGDESFISKLGRGLELIDDDWARKAQRDMPDQIESDVRDALQKPKDLTEGEQRETGYNPVKREAQSNVDRYIGDMKRMLGKDTENYGPYAGMMHWLSGARPDEEDVVKDEMVYLERDRLGELEAKSGLISYYKSQLENLLTLNLTDGKKAALRLFPPDVQEEVLRQIPAADRPKELGDEDHRVDDRIWRNEDFKDAIKEILAKLAEEKIAEWKKGFD